MLRRTALLAALLAAIASILVAPVPMALGPTVRAAPDAQPAATAAAAAAATAAAGQDPAAATALVAQDPAAAQDPGAALLHDSRDTLYRSPGGAVPAGTTVRLRLRTAHADAAAVILRVTDLTTGAATTAETSMVATGVACVTPNRAVAGLPATCDFWEASITPPQPTTMGYRFSITTTAGETLDYGDDAPDLGGAGAPGSLGDFVLTVYVRGFEPIRWLQDAVVYQVFPDRFANGDPSNDPSADDPRYGYPPDPDAQVQLRSWDQLPEGPARGRDYFGGDLPGLTNWLPELADLGVTVLYLNPIFEAASNHRYDTRDYSQVDPALGTQADWDRLVAEADKLGIRIILDGVFNHVSSDSTYFDRYGHFPTVGACESVDSPDRDWFFFHPAADGPCAGPDGPNTMDYLAWSGYNSLPVLNKRNVAVRDLVFAGSDSIAIGWLERGASGWRLDVMPDGSIPREFWQDFRTAVKATKPDAPIIGELWHREDALSFLRGDTADTTMDYRFRDAVLGYLGTVGPDGALEGSGGSAGSARGPASTFAGAILSILEDYPAAASLTAFQLLDSHDTERILWSLTPGPATRAGRELDSANVALGKARLRLASLIQMTMPGAPTIYYGDEVGVTGATDPDDRRTYPLLPGETPPPGSSPAAPGEPATAEQPAGADLELRDWYRALIATRAAHPALRSEELRFLLTDEATRTVAYARTDADSGDVAIVVVNPDPQRPAELTIPLADAFGPARPLRDGVRFVDALGARAATTADGHLAISLPPNGWALLVAAPGQDLTAPSAPASLVGSAAPERGIELTWAAGADAARYELLRSPLEGGLFERIGATEGTTFRDPNVRSDETWTYVVRAIDAAGNVGRASDEVSVLAPSPPIPSAGGASSGPTGGSPSLPGEVPSEGAGGGGSEGILVAGLLLAIVLAFAGGVIVLVVRLRRRSPR